MSDEVDEQLNNNGYNLHLNSMGLGKGLATYVKPEIIMSIRDIKKPKTQITLLSLSEVDIISVYRSEAMNTTELAHDIERMMDPYRFTVICGDFNLCYIENKQNEVTKMLENCGFSQLNREASHFQGGHIDHVYSNHTTDKFQVNIKQYCPYYLAKDHNALLITITKTSKRSLRSYGKYSTRK